MPPRLRIGSPEDWLRHAKADLALARAGLPEGCLYELLCVHAQQAVEKAIKAVLVKHGRPIARTHSIEILVDSLPSKVVRVPFLYRLGNPFHLCLDLSLSGRGGGG